MKADKIIRIVAKTLNITIDKAINNSEISSIEAKYIMFTIMQEEGLAPWEILKALKMHRTGYYYAQNKVNAQLGKDKAFTLKYTACVAAVVAVTDGNYWEEVE